MGEVHMRRKKSTEFFLRDLAIFTSATALDHDEWVPSPRRLVDSAKVRHRR